MPKTVARIVVVTRKTPLELLLQRWGTYGQAKFYLSTRGQTLDEQQALHDRLQEGLSQVLSALPPDQKVTRVDRDDLDRFLFAPDDIVLIVGQDGLVPNVAKYLEGQLTVGLNPDPAHYDGVLCRFPPSHMPHLLAFARAGTGDLEVRPLTMAMATREDGQKLLALNEIFLGHRSHQSARYRLVSKGKTERQSSSGLICATGTGSTGWARSIVEQRRIKAPMPRPDEPRLAWFVREPFPSVSTGTSMSFGEVRAGAELVVTSEMGEGGTIFADGIESDRVEFLDGQTVRIGIAERTLRLVVPRRGAGDVSGATRTKVGRPGVPGAS